MGEVMPGAEAFRTFEHAGWESVPGTYDDGFAGLTPQAAEPLLDAAGAGPGAEVLDVATGPGYVAAAAARRGAHAVGVDFSEAMVERARRRFPDLRFQVGDAEELPFEAATFDAVVMNFGLLHLGRPEQALREAHRVLRAGGRFAFTVWAPPEESIGFGIVLRAVAAHGRQDVDLPPGPPFFRFSESGECVRALRAAGFLDPRVVTVSQTWRLASPDELFRTMDGGTVRTSALLRAQSRAARTAIQAAIRAEASRYRIGTRVEFPMPAVLASARKAPGG